MAKYKYSYKDRENYYGVKYSSFLQQFNKKGGAYDYDAMIAAEKKNSKLQYAHGYNTFTNNISRGHYLPDDDLKKQTTAFQRGYKAANSAYEKSRNIKF